MLSHLSLISLSIVLPQLTIAYVGNVTYWEYNGKAGSCGQVHQNDDQVVSLSNLIMQNPPNPNKNPICGMTIYILNPSTGQEITAKVADTCSSCTEENIVVSKGIFQTMAKPEKGVVQNVTWYGESNTGFGSATQLPAADGSGSGSANVGYTDTEAASGGTGAYVAASSGGLATGAGIPSTVLIPPATSEAY
ncbi:MAG: hypothetical protein Q9167_006605 [Letrouitia subvulpina]